MKFTFEQVRDEILKIIEANPFTQNPMQDDEHSCSYDDGNGNHCIVGTLIAGQNWEMPPANGESASHLPAIVANVDNEGKVFLNALQQRADGMEHSFRYLRPPTNPQQTAPVPWVHLTHFVHNYDPTGTW